MIQPFNPALAQQIAEYQQARRMGTAGPRQTPTPQSRAFSEQSQDDQFTTSMANIGMTAAANKYAADSTRLGYKYQNDSNERIANSRIEAEREANERRDATSNRRIDMESADADRRHELALQNYELSKKNLEMALQEAEDRRLASERTHELNVRNANLNQAQFDHSVRVAEQRRIAEERERNRVLAEQSANREAMALYAQAMSRLGDERRKFLLERASGRTGLTQEYTDSLVAKEEEMDLLNARIMSVMRAQGQSRGDVEQRLNDEQASIRNRLRGIDAARDNAVQLSSGLVGSYVGDMAAMGAGYTGFTEAFLGDDPSNIPLMPGSEKISYEGRSPVLYAYRYDGDFRLSGLTADEKAQSDRALASRFIAAVRQSTDREIPDEVVDGLSTLLRLVGDGNSEASEVQNQTTQVVNGLTSAGVSPYLIRHMISSSRDALLANTLQLGSDRLRGLGFDPLDERGNPRAISLESLFGDELGGILDEEGRVDKAIQATPYGMRTVSEGMARAVSAGDPRFVNFEENYGSIRAFNSGIRSHESLGRLEAAFDAAGLPSEEELLRQAAVISQVLDGGGPTPLFEALNGGSYSPRDLVQYEYNPGSSYGEMFDRGLQDIYGDAPVPNNIERLLSELEDFDEATRGRFGDVKDFAEDFTSLEELVEQERLAHNRELGTFDLETEGLTPYLDLSSFTPDQLARIIEMGGQLPGQSGAAGP